MTGTNFDAIVVGLGAMGSAASAHLARRGKRVLGLEAFEAGHTLGSSHGESRIIRMAYFEHPDYVPLLRRAYELWAALETDVGERLLHRTGGLFVGPPDGPLVAGALQSARAHDLPHELLDAREVHRRYPVFQPRETDVALFEQPAGILGPERCIEAHLRVAQQSGAELHHQEPVRRWSATGSGCSVVTDTATYTAEQLVLTAGAWLGKLLGGVVPLRPERVTVFWMHPRAEPRGFDLGRLPIYMFDTPEFGMFYGFPHLSWPGVKIARHHSGDWCDPDTMDREVRDSDEARLRPFLADCIPDLDGSVARSVVCIYTNTPDEHFVIGRPAEYPGVVFAGGFSGHGFKFASVIGEILADLVTRGETPHPIAFLAADRFATAR